MSLLNKRRNSLDQNQQSSLIFRKLKPKLRFKLLEVLKQFTSSYVQSHKELFDKTKYQGYYKYTHITKIPRNNACLTPVLNNTIPALILSYPTGKITI